MSATKTYYESRGQKISFGFRVDWSKHESGRIECATCLEQADKLDNGIISRYCSDCLPQPKPRTVYKPLVRYDMNELDRYNDAYKYWKMDENMNT